jgi:transposase
LVCIKLLILTRKEKEKLVIELAEKGSTTREIAKAVRISLGDIGKILKKYNGEECLDEKLSTPSKAFLMFERGQKPLYVAIHLNLDEDATMSLYRSYLHLSRLDN